jgi:hypothetical protein
MTKHLVLVSLSMALSACMTAGMYRTAHVLPQNTGDLSLHMNVTRLTTKLETIEQNQNGEFVTTKKDFTVNYPNIIPEVSYHYGIADDFEVGGRVALGSAMIEIDGKYRFVGGPNETLHLAVQPALGYRSFGIIEGAHLSVPLIATYDFNDNISLNGSGFATYTHYRTPTDFDSSDNANFGGDTIVAGGALGVQFETMSGFHIMPAMEVQRSAYRGGDAKDLPKWTAIIFGVTLGWGGDKEMRKLNKMDDKLDRIDDKLDKLNGAPTPAAPPPSAPADEAKPVEG